MTDDVATKTFRNYQVAAPLKLKIGDAVFEAVVNLPQLSSCGPIEAGRRVLRQRRLGPSATIKLRPH